jgi:quercetin dioxygenase-like cupin family protein
MRRSERLANRYSFRSHKEEDMRRRDFVKGAFAIGGVAINKNLLAAVDLTTGKRHSREKHMEIKKVGSQPSVKGPTDWFTGTVRIDPLFTAPEPARVSGAHVTFEPGARTAWHTHPLRQTLIVTSGCGWAQREGGPIEEMHPGDVVWFSPGEKHWYGAAPTTAMTHIAIQKGLNGKVVDWIEHVTNEQYRR